MVKSALLRSKPLPIWVQAGAEFGEEGPDQEYDRIATELVRLRSQLQMVRGSGAGSIVLNIQVLTEEAFALKEAFTMWISEAATSWQLLPLQKSLDVATSHPSTQKKMATAHIATWMKIYSTEILILSTYISFLEQTENSADVLTAKGALDAALQNFKHAVLNLYDISDSPASGIVIQELKRRIHSAPKLLRWIVWPLSMILLAEQVQGAQRDFIEDVMRECGKASGFAVLEDVEVSTAAGNKAVK